MEALIHKQSFVDLNSGTWLYSGAETPPLAGSAEAVQQYIRSRSLGPGGREQNSRIEAECRANIASLAGGKPEQIALLSNSSEAISMIAQSLPFRSGDNVVVNTLEFPSGILPWLLLKEKGVEIRVVNHNGWQITPDDLLDRVDERTRVVMTSHVSYISGARLDYRKLYAELKKTDTLLLLDATQSLGAVPVDMNETDFLVCSSYKWLLGIHGVGILGVNPARLAQFTPRSAGWRGVAEMFSNTRFESFDFLEDARRFELGYPSYPTIYALNYSTRLLLEIGAERIESHILQLGGELIDRLSAHGYEVMTPREPEKRAGNICVVSARGDELANALRKREVYVWGGDGRFRASVHLFNDSGDLDRLMTGLAEVDPMPGREESMPE